MNPIIRTCLLFVFISHTTGALIPFEDCGSLYYLESIEVSGCSSYPCRLSIGSSVQVTTNFMIQGIAFDSDQFIQNVYFVVSSIFLEVQVTPDPCTAVKGSQNNYSCNLKNGDRIKYQATLSIQNVPPLPATLYWTIRDQATNNLVVCYRLTVILTNDNNHVIIG